MAQVTEFGYLGLGVSDVDAWKHFAGQIAGMEILDEGEGDRFYVRMDYHHHRMVIHNSGEDDMIYMGWRVAGPNELVEMEQQLSEAGVAYEVGDAEDCRERRVLGLLRCKDPAGNPTEIYHGPEVWTHQPFHPGRAMHGKFLTTGEGIGHCILRQDDIHAAYKFYNEVFGMRGSVEYKLKVPGAPVAVEPVFMHCNPRDHSIAFGVGPMEKRINHLMIEVDSLDDVGLTHDIVRENKVPVAIQLGKHANDQMLSFYFGNPSGWLWEYGWGARKSTYQSEYYPRDTFGHAMEEGGFGMDLEM
ncbi:MAG: biphenyl-2,3-diol 1,2-dioxygenase [Pseudomonadota bacterium]|nr:biphenyl-2,3-diol 1,2-dioxygenase [Pseudomonadota bacterium]